MQSCDKGNNFYCNNWEIQIQKKAFLSFVSAYELIVIKHFNYLEKKFWKE